MLIMDLVLWEYRNILFFYYLYIIAFFRKEYINGISFIPGINIEKSEPKAFIQVITNNTSYFINYDIFFARFKKQKLYIVISLWEKLKYEQIIFNEKS